MGRLLLCTDLDRTLLPNGRHPESNMARDRFANLVKHPNVTLAYVTGRDDALVKKAIKHYHLPPPQYVISDVGSTIYQLSSDRWQHWKTWETEIAGDWNGKSSDDLHQLIEDFKALRRQALHQQNKYKLSYFIPHDVDHVSLIKKINQRFIENKIKTHIIWSTDEQANIGLLDVLPEQAGKRQAIEFLMKNLGYQLDEVIFAGDSGNDISVMASPIQSIIVANASDDVKTKALKMANQNNQLDTLYIATGNFFNMNGNYSAGILEGIVHYRPMAANWIDDQDESKY